MIHKIKKISTIIVILLLVQSCSVIGLIQSKKDVTGDYTVELKPENSFGYYDMSINVIQGIAAFEGGFFTSQTSANKYLSINYLNAQGESEFNYRFTISSHAQDLSLEKISENELYLYTTLGHYDKKEASGMLRLKVTLPKKINDKRDFSKITITIDKKFQLKLDNCTPTLSEDKKSFAIRSGNSIIVASKQDVLNNDLSHTKKFDLDESQLKDKDGKTLWFQGIAMKNDNIYCMTGNNSLQSLKQIFVYDINGNLIKKHRIEKNDFAKQLDKKLEPEGLTFIGDDLYYVIIIKGKTGQNRKFLYKLD
jgi:hypothetical protein